LCSKCHYQANKEKIKERTTKWKKKNWDRFNEMARKRHASRKLASIQAYGGKCKCGIEQIEFLTIDHISDNGAEEKQERKTVNIHIWLKRRNYPPGYQVLCGSCNLKKEIERRRRIGSKTWERNQRAKIEVLNMYGPKCVCCSETDPDKLTIDHIDGGGSKEKQSYPSRNVYLFLRGKDPDRSKFQVLCQNCNQAKASFGRCPHIS